MRPHSYGGLLALRVLLQSERKGSSERKANGRGHAAKRTEGVMPRIMRSMRPVRSHPALIALNAA